MIKCIKINFNGLPKGFAFIDYSVDYTQFYVDPKSELHPYDFMDFCGVQIFYDWDRFAMEWEITMRKYPLEHFRKAYNECFNSEPPPPPPSKDKIQRGFL